MTPNLLILGGTMEATALGRHLAARGVKATLSLAGRVARPKPQPLPVRVGGFGGVDGLVAFLKTQRITHIIDATHPFAAQMSRNAVAASAHTGVPLAALSRPPWQARAGDVWEEVADIQGAVDALNRPRARVLLAVGRMHLDAFAQAPHHHYVLRLVDPPKQPLPLPDATVIIDRGPFDAAADMALMQRHAIELVVSKNAGGSGAVAKISAARALAVPVIMIARPTLPAREEMHDVDAVMRWLARHGVDLGV